MLFAVHNCIITIATIEMVFAVTILQRLTVRFSEVGVFAIADVVEGSIRTRDVCLRVR